MVDETVGPDSQLEQAGDMRCKREYHQVKAGIAFDE